MPQPFRYYLRVRYGECDFQHVVFNARYGDYFDLASTKFLRAAMVGRNLFDGLFEYQVVRQLTEWKGPARFDDVLEIDVRHGRLGTTSFTLVMALRRAGTTDTLVTCETVYVTVDKETWQKRPLSMAECEALESGAAGQLIDHGGWLAQKA